MIDGASLHANDLQVLDPIVLSITHGPSDPIRSVQP